ncbi:MAG: hypothetical protein ACRDYE_12095 [Acidimicrobiales bacterium]
MNSQVLSVGDWGARRLLGRRQLRIALGIFWLVDAGLQAEGEKFRRDYPLGTLAQSVMGAPHWLNRTIYAGINPFVAHWAWWNLASTLIQVAIGIGLVTGRSTKLALALSFVWAATIWWLGEGFGTLPSGFGLMAAGAPGAAALYILIGAMAWPRDGRTDVDRRAWISSWVVLWVGAAVLHFPFAFPVGQVLQANLEENRSSAGLLAATSNWFGRISADHAVTVTIALVVLEAAIGLGWLVDRSHRRTWLGLGILLSLFFWVVVQQLGGIPGTDATDPDTAPMVILLALAAWPRQAQEAVTLATQDHVVTMWSCPGEESKIRTVPR